MNWKPHITPEIERQKIGEDVSYPALQREIKRLNVAIKMYNFKLKVLNEKLSGVIAENLAMKKAAKVNPQDRWYIAYLQTSIWKLEDLNANQQTIIETLNALLNAERERTKRILSE